MPRDVFETTTEFEAVERERVLPPGTRWHYNDKDGTRVVVPINADIQNDVYIDETAKLGDNVTILAGLTIKEDAVIGNNVTIRRDVAAGEVIKPGTQTLL